MGTWSPDAFGNDDACDWASDLAECRDLSLVERTIARVKKAPADSLDAPDATSALAAIEVVARLRGHAGFSNSYTKNADEWVRRTRLTPSPALVNDALAALDRIVGEDSELRALWDESGGTEQWLASVDELRERLRAHPRAIEQPAEPGSQDEVASLLQRIGKIELVSPAPSAESTPLDLHRAVLASGALGDGAGARDCIARVWQALNNLQLPESERDNMLWDLAVREAQTWASEGLLDEALTDLEPWRHCSPANAPGQFDMRAMGICLAAGNTERALAHQIAACNAAPADELFRLDLALLEARLGSAENARRILASIATDRLLGLPKLYVEVIEGILACRKRAPDASQRLTAVMGQFLSLAESNPAAWPLFANWCGWWALALGYAGRMTQAAELLRHVAPLFMKPQNRELIGELINAGVLPKDTVIPSFPAIDAAKTGSRATTDHGAFKTVRSRGVNALKRVEAYRSEFARGSRVYPFLIGTDEELEQLLETLSVPEDGGNAELAVARNFDVAAWLTEHMPAKAKGWPKPPVPAMTTPLTLFDVVSQSLKPEILIGLIELDDPAELFARLGYGNWNDCPEPHVHSALHAYWKQQFGAEPIAISGDVVECIVANPPREKPAALALAREQHAYCSDIVEQGVGTTAKLASSLLAAKYWYFWWD